MLILIFPYKAFQCFIKFAIHVEGIMLDAEIPIDLHRTEVRVMRAFYKQTANTKAPHSIKSESFILYLVILNFSPPLGGGINNYRHFCCKICPSQSRGQTYTPSFCMRCFNKLFKPSRTRTKSTLLPNSRSRSV